jgi:hypothetical protein
MDSYDGSASPSRRLIKGSKMNRLCTALVIAALALSGATARAVPPTVTPSPGYDARLQESRKAHSASTPDAVQPTPSALRHHGKRKH